MNGSLSQPQLQGPRFNSRRNGLARFVGQGETRILVESRFMHFPSRSVVLDRGGVFASVIGGQAPCFQPTGRDVFGEGGAGLGAGGKFTSLRSELEGAILQILVFMKNSTPFASGRKHDVICLGRLAVDLYAQQIGSRLEDVSTFSKYLGGLFGKYRLQLRAPWSEVRDANAGWRRSHGTFPD